MTCCPDPDQTLLDDITHAALSADTGEHYEYQVLLKSSDGHLWERSCTKEIACLAQGFPLAAFPRPQAPTPFDSCARTRVNDTPGPSPQYGRHGRF
jgi:hypothetical protein